MSEFIRLHVVIVAIALISCGSKSGFEIRLIEGGDESPRVEFFAPRLTSCAECENRTVVLPSGDTTSIRVERKPRARFESTEIRSVSVVKIHNFIDPRIMHWVIYIDVTEKVWKRLYPIMRDYPHDSALITWNGRPVSVSLVVGWTRGIEIAAFRSSQEAEEFASQLNMPITREVVDIRDPGNAEERELLRKFASEIYREMISRISTDAGIGIDVDMIDDPRLKRIYQEPIPYAAAARELILNEKASLRERKIAVISMQCLSLPMYLRLLSESASMNRAESNRKVIEYLIGPGIRWSTRLALLFDHSDVRGTLFKIRGMAISDDRIRNTIDEILSGKTAAFIQERGEWQQWKCPDVGDIDGDWQPYTSPPND